MSGQTIVLNNGQQAHIDTDVSKIFVWEPRAERADYTNATGGDETLLPGTLMGRITASGKVIPLKSAAVDGSQFPVGILMSQHNDVPDTNTVQVVFAVSGDVVKDKVIFDGTDDFDTIVSARRLGDRIGFDTVGIKLVESTEQTQFDNQ